MPPLAIVGAISAAGAIGQGILGSNAAGNAASAQQQAAQQAAGYAQGSGQNAINYQQGILGQTQGNLSPYLNAGTGALANLQYLLGIAPQGNQNTYGAPGGGVVPGPSTGNPITPSGGARSSGITQGRGIVPALDVPGGGGRQAGSIAPPSVAPPTQNGAQPLSNLVNPSLGGFGSLSQGWNQPFVAPTGATEQNDPGYQFRMQQGVNALQNSAAARGTLLSGGTAAGINAYGQDYASNEYSNVYNRALGQYQQSYNIFQQNQANQYNRLAALTGMGQETAGQLGSFGQAAAGNIGNLLSDTSHQVGQDLQNRGAAQASGYVGQANALGGMLGNLTNLGQMLAMSKNGGNNGGFLPSNAGGWGDVGQG